VFTRDIKRSIWLIITSVIVFCQILVEGMMMQSFDPFPMNNFFFSSFGLIGIQWEELFFFILRKDFCLSSTIVEKFFLD
jgi:hypothetical protein